MREVTRIEEWSNRTVLDLQFTFQRRVATAVISIYFPSTLIVLVSFVSFWVDSLAVPGRVTLVITSILALMTQLISVRDSATPVSYVTALDIWFFACLSFVSATLFEFAIAYRLAITVRTNNSYLMNDQILISYFT